MPHRWSLRVYYEDTDFSGVAYHASYLRFLERGRTEYLRAAGVNQGALFAEGGAFAVRRMTLDFRLPARIDDTLTVETTLVRCGGASIDLAQAVRREAELLVDCSVRIAFVSGGRAVRLPPALARSLRA